MQDRYAGDVGDFLKFGLIRALSRPRSADVRVGLNWYLAEDESHNGDGKHVGYLRPGARHHASLAACDPQLMAALQGVLDAGTRSVGALNACGVLPGDSPVFSERLPSGRSAARGAWHERALQATAGADAVCVDPDNGVCFSTAPAKLHKYALPGELRDYAARGQSLIAYQHADRSAPAGRQARGRLDELARAVSQQPVAAIVAHRGSCRFFLITAAEQHREALLRAAVVFAAAWAPHVEIVGPAASPARG